MVKQNNEYYQIHITISGTLIDFKPLESAHNKYKIGLGHIKFNTGTKEHVVPVTADMILHEQLVNYIGSEIEIQGSIRNFRIDDNRFNVIKIFSIAEHEGQAVNEVTATCKLLGLIKKKVKTVPDTQSTVLYLLTNEKYDKHVRLTGLLFNKTSEAVALPEIESIKTYKGYLQASATKKADSNASNIELIVTRIKEREE